MILIYLIILLCTLSCSDDKSTAGTWIETTNGLTYIDITDSNGQKVNATLQLARVSDYLADPQSFKILDQNQKQSTIKNARYVARVHKDSLEQIYTWISDSIADTLHLKIQKTISIEGMAPTSFDSVFIVGLADGVAIQRDGHFKMDHVPQGKGLFLLKKNGTWHMGREIDIVSGASPAQYSIFTCDDNSAYDGLQEKSFLESEFVEPYFTSTTDSLIVQIKAPIYDSLAVYSNNILSKTLPIAQIFSFPIALTPNNNYLKFEQKGSWPLCIQVLKSNL